MSILRTAGIALVLCACPLLLAGQVRPQFEVAAIKPAAPDLSGDFVLGLNARGAQVHIAWASLLDLVNMAYRVKRYQISGPPGFSADHFTVDAKIPDGLTLRQVPEMLQSMLDVRFGMKSHWEKKELPVYTLGLSRPEPSLTEVAAPERQLSFPIGNINGGRSIIDFGSGGTFTFGDNMLDAKKLNLNCTLHRVFHWVKNWRYSFLKCNTVSNGRE